MSEVGTALDEAQAMVTALQTDKRTLEVHVEMLKARVDAHEDQQAHVSDLRVQVQTQQQHGDTLKAQHDTAIYELRLQHEAALHALQLQAQLQADSKDAVLRERDARLQTVEDAARVSARQLAESQQMLQSRDRLVESLRAQLQEKDKQLPELLASLLKAAMGPVQQEAADLRAAVATKDAKISTLESEVAAKAAVPSQTSGKSAAADTQWPPVYVLPCPKCRAIMVPGLLTSTSMTCDGCSAASTGPTKYLSCRACNIDLCVAKCVPKARPTCSRCPGSKLLQERVARPGHRCDICNERPDDHACYSCDCDFDACTACVAHSIAVLCDSKGGAAVRLGLRSGRRGERVTVENFSAGARVQRGPSWKWGEQDGGGKGTLVLLDLAARGWCRVRWDKNSSTNSYRCGRDDAHDLIYVE